MRKVFLALAVAAASLASGCATITGDTVQSIRVETFAADGAEVKGANCKLENENGAFTVTTPGNVNVRRSAKDMSVRCEQKNMPDGTATMVSRANAGMYGNIIFGGGVGAIIDHSKGTAYTYPQWVKVIMGKMLSFDRSDDKDGQPSLAKDGTSGGQGGGSDKAVAAPAK